jgi:hypothetical protein
MPWNGQTLQAVALYHAKELAARWRSQAASPLARWFLTFALALLAGIVLLGFAAAEAARQAELRRLGLDTILLEAPSVSPLPELGRLPPDHWAGPLQAQGELRFLQQLPDPAFTAWEEPMPVFVAAAPLLAKMLPPDAHRSSAPPEGLWLTRTLPPGRRLVLRRQGLPFPVITAEPSGAWDALGLANFALVALAPAEHGDARGRLDVLLFTPHSEASPAKIIAAIRDLYAANGEAPPTLHDPSPYRAAVAAFSRSQGQWRRGMLVLLAACVLLVFVSIGMLEEKQTRYTQALLRSLGVPGPALFVFSALENTVLANSALLAALAASRLGAPFVLSLAGAEISPVAGYSPEVILLLFGAVNCAVALSLVPLARALRRPVGLVLS